MDSDDLFPALGFAPPALATAPFPHFLAGRCIAPWLETQLLDWFETAAPWTLVETDFYEQYEFSLLDVPLPETVRPVADPCEIDDLRHAMSAAFGVSLDPRVTAIAHKLVPGQRIGIHNDFLEGGETHRLTVQLNRGLSDEDGGLFMLFNSSDAADVHAIIRPLSGSGLGFAIGPHSHHAVSRVHGGERYTIVFSFHESGRAAPAE